MAPRVLIVDDDEAFRQVALRYLREADYEVFTARSVDEGLLLLGQERPDVVLLAADRPGWDGAAVCQRYGADPAAGYPVLLVSASPLEPVPGADGYIRRDASGNELVTHVQHLVRLRHAEWALQGRIKELNYFYRLSNLVEQPGLTLDMLLQGAVELFPPAWQYPEITGARILLQGQEYRTRNFQVTAWMQSQTLLMHGQPAGIAQICYLEQRPESDEGPFLKEERRLLDAITERLGRVAERLWAEQSLRDYAEQLEILREIDLSILSARSLQEIATATLSRIQQLVPYRRISIALLDPGADAAQLLVVYANGETAMPSGAYVPLSEVWFLEDLRQGVTYQAEDLQTLDMLLPALESLQHEGVRSYISVPLVVRGELVGALSLGTDHPGGLAPEKVAALQEFAPALAVATQQTRLRRQLEAALHRTRRDYAALVNSLDGIVWEADPETLQFSFVSQQAERLLGYPVERWTGEPRFWVEHLHPDDRIWAPDFCAQATARGKDHEFEYRMLAADGRTLWLHDLVTVVVEEDRPVRLRGVMIDITRQKAMQSALLQSERLAAMGTLSASLAHEINNPLQAIVGSLGLAEEALQEGQDVGRYLHVACEEVQRLRRIMERMRELYRPEVEERSLIDLNKLLAQVVELCGRPCHEHRVQIHWDPVAGLPPLFATADRIKQVLLNLLLNAVEAMPGGGLVWIRTLRTERPSGIQIEVEDNGPGIDPELLDHLFEPFRSTKPAGTGLGLFISHGIVHDHNGSIQVESQPGQGSTFRVWLPVRHELQGTGG